MGPLLPAEFVLLNAGNTEGLPWQLILPPELPSFDAIVTTGRTPSEATADRTIRSLVSAIISPPPPPPPPSMTLGVHRSKAHPTCGFVDIPLLPSPPPYSGECGLGEVAVPPLRSPPARGPTPDRERAMPGPPRDDGAIVGLVVDPGTSAEREGTTRRGAKGDSRLDAHSPLPARPIFLQSLEPPSFFSSPDSPSTEPSSSLIERVRDRVRDRGAESGAGPPSGGAGSLHARVSKAMNLLLALEMAALSPPFSDLYVPRLPSLVMSLTVRGIAPSVPSPIS
mmetsp:Transcript_5182/g.14955  ORF Transcript_5182/g.14955 Transcript_5182/m.14955 type:complete len:281 (-) Transcript_5182:2145-2987(-)